MKKFLIILLALCLAGCAIFQDPPDPEGIKVIPNDGARIAQVNRCIKIAQDRLGLPFKAQYLEVSFRPSDKLAWSNKLKQYVAVSPDGVPAFFTGGSVRHGIVCYYRRDNGVFNDEYLIHEVAHSIAHSHRLRYPAKDGVHYDGFRGKGILGW